MNKESGILDRMISFFLRQKLVVAILVMGIVAWGTLVAPFDWNVGNLPRDPVHVDAIPDIGENQQIVFTTWEGRSPQDVEDQISYPLTVSLLGIPGVKTVRSFSMFGFSTIYMIFEEDVEFYWSRSRILEKLASLPAGTLPDGAKPALGPDATALGQIYWYTIEGRDEGGKPTGGWDPHEIRSTQDWHVRYALASAKGVSEVASVGGFVQEYQVDVDPDAMRAYGVSLEQVIASVKMSNLDVGARTIERNGVEYVIRGVGFVREVEDLENAVVRAEDGTPVLVKDVAHVQLGPALRRGVLDKGGTEVVGGVVVVRYGDNPLATIEAVKKKIAEIAPGLPKKTLEDGTVSQLTIVPFYDRTELIHETIETLETALREEILVTILVVILMVLYLRSSLLIAALLPLAVLICFIGMRTFGIDANIVALSGIAIAIGTMVDMGIVVCESILKHFESADPDESRLAIVERATREVGSAVLTAVATTVVSFLPVFTLTAAEGKLFRPLAFTKTFALSAAVLVALFIIPAAAHILFRRRKKTTGPARPYVPLIVAGVVLIILSMEWLPLGPERGLVRNVFFVFVVIGGLLGALLLYQRAYGRILGWALANKRKFLLIPGTVLLFGGMAWLGFDRLFPWLPAPVRTFAPVSAVAHAFPGLGREFMPALDEGSFLFMPTTMPHASIGEAYDVLRKQDMSIQAIPEVRSAVGKLGRVESPLDPAPVSMIETIIDYHAEYRHDEAGRRLRFRFDRSENDLFRTAEGDPVNAPDGEPYVVQGRFVRDEAGALIPDRGGRPFRVWRPALDPDLNEGRAAWPGVRSPEDIWDAIGKATKIPGTTGAPKLQPIAARIVMLQSGMRAPLGIKVKGPDLPTIEAFGLELERELKQVPGVRANTVIADRIVGKPYYEIHIDRQSIARHGIHLENVQNVIESAIGGKPVSRTVEGRERYPVRVRYMRELRDNIDDIERIFVTSPGGASIPLAELTDIRYVRGPQVIKSEDTFLLGYVIFDKDDGIAEVDVVENARAWLDTRIASGDLTVPAGVSYTFAGSYENQVRAQKRLSVVLPLSLVVIFLILYFQFRSAVTASLVFSGVGIAWAGGFLMLWMYGQSWFLDFSLLGVSMRDLFLVHPVNLSVAVWVGFLALFGIATDDGVIIGTYLNQSFDRLKPQSIAEIREATLTAGRQRIRPCLMTVGTTILALLPVLTSTGRGADIMIPMAIPSFGGMIFVVLSTILVPVLYCAVMERRIAGGRPRAERGS